MTSQNPHRYRCPSSSNPPPSSSNRSPPPPPSSSNPLHHPPASPSTASRTHLAADLQTLKLLLQRNVLESRACLEGAMRRREREAGASGTGHEREREGHERPEREREGRERPEREAETLRMSMTTDWDTSTSTSTDSVVHGMLDDVKREVEDIEAMQAQGTQAQTQTSSSDIDLLARMARTMNENHGKTLVALQDAFASKRRPEVPEP